MLTVKEQSPKCKKVSVVGPTPLREQWWCGGNGYTTDCHFSPVSSNIYRAMRLDHCLAQAADILLTNE